MVIVIVRTIAVVTGRCLLNIDDDFKGYYVH